MTLTINITEPLIPQVITALRGEGFSCSKIAELLGISRATLYNRYLSHDKYMERMERLARKKEKPTGTKIIVSKGGRPAGARNKKKNSRQSTPFWTQEELRELIRLFGAGWKQVARAVKEIAPQEKNLEALRRLAKKHAGKTTAYICKAIKGGAYFEELHRLEDERWNEKQKEEIKKNERITPEMIAETDEIIRQRLGHMINPPLTISEWDDDEAELEDFCRRYGIDPERGKEIWRRL